MGVCAGCGVDGAPPFVGKVPACPKCGALFLEQFDGGEIPLEGMAISEGPVTRIADAILAELGFPSRVQPIELIACRRPPRRRKLRR